MIQGPSSAPPTPDGWQLVNLSRERLAPAIAPSLIATEIGLNQRVHRILL
jgi:hypothetical protein